MRILTGGEARQLDRWAIEVLGIPGPLLMEHAARGLRERLLQVAPDARRITVVCGPGNNGGDGLALVRLLWEMGRPAHAFLLRWGRELSADCALQLEWLRRLQISVTVEPELDQVLREANRSDLLVDALFGTGLKAPLRGEPARWVEALSQVDRPVLAVDLPSGLSADAATIEGVVWRANWTVTFGTLKPAHVLPPAANLCGEVTVAGLGFPVRAAPSSAPPLWWLTRETVYGSLEPRKPDAHKGEFGHLLLVAGSASMPGAVLLAAKAAVRSGVGLVTAAVPAAIHAAMPGACPEAMWVPMGQEPLPAAFHEDHLAALEPFLKRASALAVGPGLGRTAETQEAVRKLAQTFPRPLVLDADGLAPFEGYLERLQSRPGPTVLTPHPGELARLLGSTASIVQSDRLRWAREAARQSGAVVVLKGHRTVVSKPDGEAWINSSGTPALAVGGSGDVLTGLLGGLLGQRLDPARAATLAVFVHGLAGEKLVRRGPKRSLAAGELALEVGGTLGELFA